MPILAGTDTTETTCERGRSLAAPGAVPWARVDGTGHAVQLYESDDFLVETLTPFFADGLAAGEAAVVIATGAHRDALAARLGALGFDLATHPRWLALDATETLARFMVDGMPDEARFVGVVGGAIRSTANGHRPPVRAFGEMVGVLWAAGNRDAALRLESFWNRLADELPFALVCGYPGSAFARADDAEPFRRICDAHSHVVPAESYPRLGTAEDRLRAVALMQQRSRSLDAAQVARESAEAALRRQQREMVDFFENAPIAFSWVDADGIIVQANRAELALLGYAAGEYVGRPVADFHVDRAVLDDILRRLKAGETLHDYEARLRCKDGSIKHVLIDSNVRWKDGRFVHTRCSTRDVTRLKRVEEDLTEAVRQGEIANRAKDEFLSVVTHELRTPLAAILGWASVLRAGTTGERAARAVDTIERSGRVQVKLIEDLLDVSRVVAGRMRLDLRLVDPAVAIRAALDTIRPAADAKHVGLEVRLDDTAGPVAADADRLQQIAWNLLSNAVKFTPGGGRVGVELDRRDEGVRLVVRDTGRGIAREFVPFVFERFRQADAAATRRTGGLGLGLAITRHLVELHGGTITVASDGEGRGAEFTITLPLAPASEDPGGRIGAAP